MKQNFLNRRDFISFLYLSLFFLLTGCSNLGKKVKVSFQTNLLPKVFKDSFPKEWKSNNLDISNLKKNNNRKIYSETDFVILNDGWINKLNFNEFKEMDKSIFNKLDKRSKDYLNLFQSDQIKKIFPVGLVPYAVVIKKTNSIDLSKTKSWDFLLSRELKEKIILPNSPRTVISISNKINGGTSLRELRNQVKIYDDKNALNWLLYSEAIVAVVPYTLCYEYLKMDSRLTIVFPEEGVPLNWYFILQRSNISQEILFEWFNLLQEKSRVFKLMEKGWYLPFSSEYIKDKYKDNNLSKRIKSPSKICWENSWSLGPIDYKRKMILENIWNYSSSP